MVWPTGSERLNPMRPINTCCVLMVRVAFAELDCSAALVKASRLVSKQSENATEFSPPFASSVMARQFVRPLLIANGGTVMSRTALAWVR